LRLPMNAPRPRQTTGPRTDAEPKSPFRYVTSRHGAPQPHDSVRRILGRNFVGSPPPSSARRTSRANQAASAAQPPPPQLPGALPHRLAIPYWLKAPPRWAEYGSLRVRRSYTSAKENPNTHTHTHTCACTRGHVHVRVCLFAPSGTGHPTHVSLKPPWPKDPHPSRHSRLDGFGASGWVAPPSLGTPLIGFGRH
jgi:hypothetical protein